MGGLRRICQAFGGLTATDAAGRTTKWVFDYAAQVAVTEAEMPVRSERWKASERARRAARRVTIEER